MKKKENLLHFGVRILGKCIEHQVGAYAAQSAFFILMSAIPFLILFMQIVRFLPYTRADVLYAIENVFPDYMIPAITSIVKELYSHSFSVLGITILAALWSSSKATHSITFGLENIATGEEFRRSWFAIRFWALLYTAVMEGSLILLLAATVFWKKMQTEFFMRFLDRNSKIFMLNSGFKWVVIFLIMTLMFSFMYTIFPKQKMRFVHQIPGALMASAGWFVFSFLVMIYVNYFDGFSMYGSLATLVLLMFWLYIGMYMLMIGAEVNEELRESR